MIRELCEVLKNKIVAANLPFIDMIAGAVKTVTYTDEDETGSKYIYTFPVSWQTNAQPCKPTSSPELDLIPDSSKKGICYFEQEGASVMTGTGDRTGYAATMTLVCWYNKLLITGYNYNNVQTNYIAQMQRALGIGRNPFNQYPFTRVMVLSTRILPQDGSIFTKYTYVEQYRQYLMQPFEYFAMQLDVRFSVADNCLQPVPVSPDICVQTGW